MSHHCQFKAHSPRRAGHGRLALVTALLFQAVACAPPASGASAPTIGPREQPIVAGQPDTSLAAIAPDPVDAPATGSGRPLDLDPSIDQSESGGAPSPARPGPAELPFAATETPGGPSAEADGPADSIPAPGQSAASCDLSQPAPPISALDPADRWRSFREPLPPAARWNPPGPRRVGLQAGHWFVEQVPLELRGLGAGAFGGGKQEWEVNLDLAQRTKGLLETGGVAVDLLPTTVPPGYRAHAFVSIHADGDPSGRLVGFKIARPGFSSIPEPDDRLVASLNAAYATATGLPRDDEHITPRMRYYYAFNSRRYCHAVAPGVPQAIVEAGFLTSSVDQVLLLGNPDLAAQGIANGVLNFLDSSRALAQSR